MVNIIGPCGLSHDGDSFGITPESDNIITDPLQRSDLIQQSKIRVLKCGVREKPKHAQPIGNRYNNDAFRCQVVADIVRLIRPTTFIAATMNINNDGQYFGTLRLSVRSPNIQIKTVFTDLGMLY